MTKHFPWQASRLVAPASLHHFTIGNRPVLFCEKRQKLLGLNATADYIWRSLALGHTPIHVCSELAGMGIPATEASVFVQDAATSWLDTGQLTPREVLDHLAHAASATRYVRIHDLTTRIDFLGSASPDAFDAVFGHFGTSALAAGLSLSVVGCQQRYFTFEGTSPLSSCPAEELIPQFKAVLTEHYVSSVRHSFLIHGALVVRRNRGLLICGSPGAGKSTLCVALVGSGYEYHADDIVRVQRDGRAVGAAFAPAVKRGAWPLVAPYAPQINDLPTYRRADGQHVRYLPTRISDESPRAIGDVLLLDRRPGADAALETVEPLESVTTILESAFSIKGAIDADALRAFARVIEAAGCYRLVYSDVGQAVRAIDTLSR